MSNRDPEEQNSQPAKASLREYDSLKNMYPASAVVIGDKNVNTVASESDKYCKEKYTPNNPKNLGDDKIRLMVKGV